MSRQDATQQSNLPPTAPPPVASVPHAQTLAVPGVSRFGAGSIVAEKYELIRILGQGGMGSVWVARNITLDVEVAIKLVRSDLGQDTSGIAHRMLQEARAAASIGHPAIVRVFDFGFTDTGDPYIVMELLHGESLARGMARRTKIAPTRAVQTLLPVIDAVGAAHAQGIVHRDLKPENIFLSRLSNGRLEPKVLDFGIAKLDRHDADRITTDGTMIGSPAYMSPEQVRGQPDVDNRADIWSIAVVLYEMLSGALPFAGDGMHAMILNVVSQEPSPIIEHGVDEPELWKIIACALDKNRDARFDDMRSLGRALANWLLVRNVTDDVCGSPLARWMADVPLEKAPGLSFFPSGKPEPLEILEKEDAPESPALEPKSASGIRSLAQTLDALVTSGAASAPRYWLIATVSSAIVAFVAAATWGLSSADEPSAAYAPTEETALQAKKKRTLASAAPVAPSSSAEVVDVPQQPEPRPAVARASAPRPVRAAAVRRNAVKRPVKNPELKDPFSD